MRYSCSRIGRGRCVYKENVHLDVLIYRREVHLKFGSCLKTWRKAIGNVRLVQGEGIS